MKRALPFIIEGTPEEKQRIERILREIATTDSGYALLFDGTLEKGRRCTIQINDDEFKDRPGVLGLHTTDVNGRQDIFLRSGPEDSELFATVVHEIGHAYDRLAGGITAHPVEGMINRKFTEASSYGIEAQICWEQEHKGSHVPRVSGPPITAWSSYKKANPYKSKKFEEACRKSVSAVESGEARTAVAEDILADPGYMKDLETESIGLYERKFHLGDARRKPPEQGAGAGDERKQRMANLRKSLKIPFIFSNMDGGIRKKLESRLRKEARLVREGSSGRLDALLVDMGLPPSGMKESEASDEAVKALKAWREKRGQGGPSRGKYGEAEEFLNDFYDRRFLAQNGEAPRQAAASGNEKVMMPKALGSPEHKERINRILAEIASTPKGHALLHGRPAGEDACNIAFDDALCGSQRVQGLYSDTQDIVLLDSRMDDAWLFMALADGLLRERHGKDGVSPELKGDPGERMAIRKVLEADICTSGAQIAWQYHKTAHENPLPVWEEMQYAQPEVAQVFESACGQSGEAANPEDVKARAFCGILAGAPLMMANVEHNVLLYESLGYPSWQNRETGGLDDTLGRLDVMKGIAPEAKQMVVQAAGAERKRIHEPNYGRFAEISAIHHFSTRGMEVVEMPKTILEKVAAGITSAFNSAARRLLEFLEGRPGQTSAIKRKGTVKCP